MKFRIRYLFLGIVITSAWTILQILNLPWQTQREWSDLFGIPMIAAMFSKIVSPILAIIFFRQGSKDFQDANIRKSTEAFICGILSTVAFLVFWFGLPRLPDTD
jgi:hypothetical protein